MAISREKKGEILTKLGEIASKGSVVFTHAKKLTVNESNDMRRKLDAAGIGYYVAKKSLMRKAFGESSVTGDMPELPGEIAVAYSDDLTAPAREIFNFKKVFGDERLALVGGTFEGEFKDQVSMLEIAQIPSHDQLKGMFVNVINSPIQGLAVVLNALAEKRSA